MNTSARNFLHFSEKKNVALYAFMIENNGPTKQLLF